MRRFIFAIKRCSLAPAALDSSVLLSFAFLLVSLIFFYFLSAFVFIKLFYPFVKISPRDSLHPVPRVQFKRNLFERKLQVRATSSGLFETVAVIGDLY